MISLAIDVVIVVLLAVALGYGWHVSRRVTKLMAALHDIEPMVRAFSEAVDKSEESVKELKTATEVAGHAVTQAAHHAAGHRIEPRLTAAPIASQAPVAAPAAAMVQMPDPEAAFASRRAAQRQAPAPQTMMPQTLAPSPAQPQAFAPQPGAAPEAPFGLMQLGASKQDLVRSFFETSRSRAV